MKFKLNFLILLATFSLVACQNDGGSTNEFNDEEIKELVNDYSINDHNGEVATITGTALTITQSDGQEEVYQLPEDEFFVSIAPFLDNTHPCTYHSLTGCQGEMIEQELNVYVEDQDGQVVIDQKMTTLANGFIDLWLPRDQTYQITITHQGKEAVSQISTFDNDATCITTMQLI